MTNDNINFRTFQGRATAPFVLPLPAGAHGKKLGEHCKLPGRGPKRSPGHNAFLLHLEPQKALYVTRITSRPAIARKPRCGVYKFWPKYKCEKRASSIALFYGVDVDK